MIVIITPVSGPAFVGQLAGIQKLCEYDIGILYSLEFSSEDKLDFLNKLRLKEIYAFKGGIIDNWKWKDMILLNAKIYFI